MRRIIAVCAALPLIALCSCSGEDGQHFVKKVDRQVTVDPEGAASINVSQCAGKCRISCGDTDKVVVSGQCEVSGLSDKKVSSVAKSLQLKCAIEDGCVYVSFIDINTGEEIGEGSGTSPLKSVNVTTDLDITVPAAFDSFVNNANVGDVYIDGLSGSFDIRSEVGDIDLVNVGLTGDSVVEAKVGNVECSLAEVGKCRMDIKADVGCIEIDTNGLGYEEVSKSDKLVEQQMEILIDGKCTLDMRAEMGSVKVSK